MFPGRGTVSRAFPWLMGVIVLAVAVACYWPSLHGGYLWDDPAHITAPQLRDWAGLVSIWTDVGATQEFYPVLHSAFWFQYQLWGDAVLGYHLVNVFLHAGSCIVLAFLLRRLWHPKKVAHGATGVAASSLVPDAAAWIAALLFAVHPVCVESVAWITEQKNTLSLFFLLLATLAYFDFADSRRASRYWLAFVLFFLAVASKPATVVMPAAVLVLIWWRAGKVELRPDVIPTLPFFALSMIAGLVTVWVETHHVGAAGENFDWSALERVLLAGRIVWFYLGKLLWPAELIFYYERWNVSEMAAGWWPYLIASVAVTVVLWAIRHRTRGPLATWMLFVGTLFPVLGFFNVYGFNFSQVADHFQYLPCMVFLAAAAGGIATLLARAPAWLNSMASVAGLAVLAFLGVRSHHQSALYVDNETLFRSVIDRNPESWMAHHNVGLSIAKAGGRVQEAIAAFRRAIELNPEFPDIHLALGIELMKTGAREEALARYRRALELRPHYAEAMSALAVEISREPERREEAYQLFEEALRIRPFRPEIHANYANVLARDPARLPEAIAHFEEALFLFPGYSKALNDYGVVLAGFPKRRADAVRKFESALAIEPGYHEARYNLAATLAEMPGREADAIAHYERTLGANPGLAQAHYGLANVLSRDPQRASEAVEHYEAAIRILPGFAEARANLANLLVRIPGRLGEGLAQYDAALEIDPSLFWVHFNLASQLARLPDHRDDAAAHFQEAIRLKPDYADALNGLAILYAQQGRFEEARTSWQRALQIDPNYQAARENLRRLEELAAGRK